MKSPITNNQSPMAQPTTAALLLNLIFEHHKIRYVVDEHGNPHFIRNDIAKALKISHTRKSVNHLLDPSETGVTKVTTVEASGITRVRPFTTLTESGVLALVCTSRKPAAKRFRVWLTSEVIPQLIRYGSYIPGATPADRCKHLYHRWKTERATETQDAADALADTSLLTISAFAKAQRIPARDILAFSNTLRRIATKASHTPTRYYIGGKMTPAWPEHLLHTALTQHQPTLALPYHQ